MKLSQREVVLVFLLAVFLVIFIGLNALIKPALAANKEKQATLDELDQKIIQLQSDLQILSIIDDQLTEQHDSAVVAAKPFSKSIEQPQLDQYINKLVNKYYLTQNAIDISEKQISNADYYSQRVTTEEIDTNIPIQQASDVINGQSNTTDTTTAQEGESTTLMYCTTVNLTVTGSHSRILSFINALYADGRALVVDSLNITKQTNSSYEKATLSIRLFAAPSID
jgi:Tfp pilus assembly protein PilO